MHEEPQIPNYGPPGKGIVLEEGMVLAIEPMVNAGRHMVRMGDDGWAIYSQDGSLAAHFEFTVAITADGPAHPHAVARDRGARRSLGAWAAGGGLSRAVDRRARLGRPARLPRAALGVEQPRLVREHDRLDAVAQVELLQHVGDVGLDRRVADEQLLADLGVGEAAGDQAEHVALARGQLVERLRRRRGAAACELL